MSSPVVSSFVIVAKNGQRSSLYIHADRSCSIQTDIGETTLKAIVSRETACDLLIQNRDNVYVAKLRKNNTAISFDDIKLV